ncbi:MAG TPA: SLC13 family permease [Trueperaceae bacterium]|nr:SLC13 family permease [Trueperaceae bacterium]
MSPDLYVIIAILVGAVVLFVSDKVRLDAVALLVVLALALSGVVTPAQALAGFADPLVAVIAGLFVVSAALTQTGIAGAVGAWLARVAGGRPARMTVAVTLATATLSAFMSSTGTVAIMLPIVVRLAYRFEVSPSKLLIPVAYAAMLGGTLTLIATPPNLVVSQVLADAGFGALGFFSLAPIGLALLAVGTLYMATLGRGLLPARAPGKVEQGGHERLSMRDVARRFELEGMLHRLLVPAGSGTTGHAPTDVRPAGARLAGATLGDLSWPETRGIRVVAIDTDSTAVATGLRSRKHLAASKRIGPQTRLDPGDRLLVSGAPAAVAQLVEEYGLIRVPEAAGEDLAPRNLRFVELLVTPRSRWIGRSLAEMRFRQHHGAVVVALKRGSTVLTDRLHEERIRFADVLLVRGRDAAVSELLRERQDAVVISEAASTNAPAPAAARAPLAVVTLLAMLAAMSLTSLPLYAIVLVAVLALVAGGCLSAEEAYRSVQWPTVILIAGMLPLAAAFESAGGAALLADSLITSLGSYGAPTLLLSVYLASVVATTFLSNTTSAVLLAPIALQVALLAGLSPAPFLVVVAIGASSSFLSPVSSPVSAMVLGPGQYRFTDFVRVGAPLQLVLAVVTLVLVPLLFPFRQGA